MWSCTLQRFGSPSHPSRFFPLNSGLKPSLAKAPIAHSDSRISSFLFIFLSPLDGYGANLYVLQRLVLRSLRNEGYFFHHLITVDDLAEHRVLIIQPGGGSHG